MQAPPKGLRVLLVEDEPLVAMFAEDVLDRLGCTVVGPAHRLDQGLALAEAGGVDAAILDLSLGRGTTSVEVAQSLARQGVPFVFATGYSSDRLPEEFRDRPVVGKPFDERALAEALAGLVHVP